MNSKVKIDKQGESGEKLELQARSQRVRRLLLAPYIGGQVLDSWSDMIQIHKLCRFTLSSHIQLHSSSALILGHIFHGSQPEYKPRVQISWDLTGVPMSVAPRFYLNCRFGSNLQYSASHLMSSDLIFFDCIIFLFFDLVNFMGILVNEPGTSDGSRTS
jgi:hypothetical protein